MPRVTFDIPRDLLEIVEQFQKKRFCKDRAEALRRMVGNSAIAWLEELEAS